MSAMPPTATELAPRIGATRWANRGLDLPRQTSRTRGNDFTRSAATTLGWCGQAPWRGSDCAGLTERSGCRNYRVISGELRPAGASTTTLSKSMSIFPSTIGLRDSISEGAYHGCFSTTPF